MEKNFTHEMTGTVIHAPLGGTLIHATMRNCDLVPAFLDALKDTVEHEQIMTEASGANSNLNVITDKDAADNDPRWNSEDISFLLEEIFDVLNAYAPDGYYFGAHPDNDSDLGYWPASLHN